MKKNTKLFAVPILFLMLLYPVSALGIPILGVAPTSGGTYYGPYEEYLDYFADTFVTSFDGNPGFIMPPSGGSLTVWYGANNGKVDLNVDIYLATNSAAGDSFRFNGSDFGSINETGLQTGGYKDHVDGDSGVTYYGLNLGSINGSWELLPDSAGWKGTWYIYSGVIEYSNFQGNQEDWMFAIADMDKDGVIFENGRGKGDAFSPKTTSCNTPEPTTMLLLGTGLIALAGLGRKQFMRKTDR